MTAAPLTFTADLRPDPAPQAQVDRVLADPGFGRAFTDHMVLARWDAGVGWHDARVTAYGPLSLDPAAVVLHYAQEVFEGLKAYRHADGSVWTFRPQANAARMARSCARLALPELSEQDFVGSLRALVQADERWVPAADAAESSLYLRPFMFGSEAFLGVRAAGSVTYGVIASPSGPYFSGGVAPVSLWVASRTSRAGAGGTGAAKCGGNYAASLLAQAEAAEHGCDQVVFLDASTRTNIDELGGMNVFLVLGDDTLVTPQLTDSILPGVTRDSIIELARGQGMRVEERPVTLAEWQDGVRSGRVTEVFACGTAAVVQPVGRLVWDGGEVDCGAAAAGGMGPVTARLRGSLLDIQYGRVPDERGWLTRLA